MPSHPYKIPATATAPQELDPASVASRATASTVAIMPATTERAASHRYQRSERVLRRQHRPKLSTTRLPVDPASTPTPSPAHSPHNPHLLNQEIETETETVPDQDSEIEAEVEAEARSETDTEIEAETATELEPETDSEALFRADIVDMTGIRSSTLRAYSSTFRRWEEFYKAHAEEYGGHNGRALFTVDSEAKMIRFFQEYIFTRRILKHSKIGADIRTQIDVRGRRSSSSSPPPEDADLLQMLNDAPRDLKGRKMITVPLGNHSILQTRKAMMRLHSLQLKRKDIGVSPISPSEMMMLESMLKEYRNGLVVQEVQSGQRRTADGVLRDSYSLEEFNEMMVSLWTRQTELHDLNYRDMFCLAARHSMLLRDEDLRYLNFSDCFNTIVTKRHEGGQQPIALTFKLNKGKTNKSDQNWYACVLRHHDVRRCPFSAFAFYMFQLWQGEEHTIVKRLQFKDDIHEILSAPDWSLLKVLQSGTMSTESITAQTTLHAINKLFDEIGISSSKKTHGGRHAGTVEATQIGIHQNDIKDGGRWTAERGRMETFYMPSLPSDFAFGMASFYNKPFFLPRNSVVPPIELQQMIFPWIEDAYGKDNAYWKGECLKEMNEVDPDIVPDTRSAAPTASGTVPHISQPRMMDSAANVHYSNADVAKSGFLRLLVRCRRIILQDAAARLHYQQDSRILQDDVFKSPMFRIFQKEMSVAVDTPVPDPSQQYPEVVPELTNELRTIAHTVTTSQQSQLRLERQLQQQHELILQMQQQLQQMQHEQMQHARRMEHEAERARQQHSQQLVLLENIDQGMQWMISHISRQNHFPQHHTPIRSAQSPPSPERQSTPPLSRTFKTRKRRETWIPYEPEEPPEN